MKTYQHFALVLGLVSVTARAQDFQAVPPDKRPNAAELAYFHSQYPPVSTTARPDSASVWLVVDFLTDLTTGQFEAAHARLADDFRAYGPGYQDFLGVDDLTGQWERDLKLFADQHLTVESSLVTAVATGKNQGTWVYLKVIWSAMERSVPGKLVRIPFHQLALVNNNRIERTYVSYGNDQLFYDLGFPIYTNGTALQQARTNRQR